MSIIVNSDTVTMVQGITGHEGSFHTLKMLNYGTKIVAGVTPGKGGEKVYGVPVYDSIEEALIKHPEINSTVIFVPAKFASDAVYEAIGYGIKLIVIITEHIPIHEALRFVKYAEYKRSIIIGPNSPGIISPKEKVKLGILPGNLFKGGEIGIASRSGTLTYEIAYQLTKAGLGQTTCIGIGGDPVTGLDFIKVVKMFNKDPETKGIVIVGEIGGDLEERLANYVKKSGMIKPMVAFIAGRSAPKGKRMGHAGAIISLGMGDAKSKIKALEEVGIKVAKTPSEVPFLFKKHLY